MLNTFLDNEPSSVQMATWQKPDTAPMLQFKNLHQGSLIKDIQKGLKIKILLRMIVAEL